jgi:DNA-binding transcriptional MerR regulator
VSRTVSSNKRRDIREALEAGIKLNDIKELLSTSSATITEVKREMGLPIRPQSRRGTSLYIKKVAQPEPIGILPPEDYVAAFEARVLEYHTLIRAKDAEIERLSKENSTLRAEYQQVVFRAANWTGPTSTIRQSLGNGG